MPVRILRIAAAPLLAPVLFVALLLTALLCGLAGCAPASRAGLPDGVLVSVHQNRPDTEDRRVQVRIVNGSASALTVNALSFSSPQFAETAPYPKAPSTIRAGGTLDLPVSLPKPVCGDDGPARGTAEVRLEYALESGQTGDVVVVPDDPLDQLDGISERDCLQYSMDAVAELREPDQIRIEQAGGRLVAFVDLAVAPTGSPGSFTIESVDDTVLFGLFDPSSATPRGSLRIDLTVTGSDAPGGLTIPLVPRRCDAHAVAEDKRGTLLPLRVRVGDAAGIRYFSLSDDRKGELYSYLNNACSQR